MAIIQSFEGSHPRLGARVFVATNAAVIGDVAIGDRASLWFGCVVRGDVSPIRIGEETSIQDNAVVHVTGGKWSTEIGHRVTVGHGAIIHGCQIGDLCIIGMGATVLDGARVEDQCIIGAGALVTPGTIIPSGHLAVGAPARVRRALDSKERDHLGDSADRYVALAARYVAGP